MSPSVYDLLATTIHCCPHVIPQDVTFHEYGGPTDFERYVLGVGAMAILDIWEHEIGNS